jgi:hypothetical protein
MARDSQRALPWAPNSGRRVRPDGLCIYCPNPADTRDHVPPKCLLEEPWPPNLRHVPSCSRCNGLWSKGEEYLIAVLANIGSTPALQAKVEVGGKVDRALQNSPAFDNLLINSLQVTADGRVHMRVDLERTGEVLRKIAYGLFCLRYGQSRPMTDFRIHWFGPEESIAPPSVEAAQWYWPGLRRKKWTVVQAGIFEFLFAKGWMVEDAPLICLMRLHCTLLAAVSCPAPSARKGRQLSQKAW